MVIAAYTEDVTRWRENMNFMFEWQEQHLTSERSEHNQYINKHKPSKNRDQHRVVQVKFRDL